LSVKLSRQRRLISVAQPWRLARLARLRATGGCADGPNAQNKCGSTEFDTLQPMWFERRGADSLQGPPRRLPAFGDLPSVRAGVDRPAPHAGAGPGVLRAWVPPGLQGHLSAQGQGHLSVRQGGGGPLPATSTSPGAGLSRAGCGRGQRRGGVCLAGDGLRGLRFRAERRLCAVCRRGSGIAGASGLLAGFGGGAGVSRYGDDIPYGGAFGESVRRDAARPAVVAPAGVVVGRGAERRGGVSAAAHAVSSRPSLPFQPGNDGGDASAGGLHGGQQLQLLGWGQYYGRFPQERRDAFGADGGAGQL